MEGQEKFFSTGSDLKSMYNYVTGNGGINPADYLRHQYKLFFLLSRIRKPVLPFVQGKCTGAGIGLALNSNLCVGTETSSFAVTSCRVGLPIEGGSTYWLSKLPMNIGKMFALTGSFLLTLPVSILMKITETNP